MARTVELTPFTCTDVELALLGGLLGGDALPGLPEPFRGWFAVEMEDAFNQVRDSLFSKGFLESRPDGALIVDMSIAMLVCACVYANQIFILNYTPAGRRQRTRYFFLEPKLAVELAAQWSTPPLYDLTPYPGEDAVICRLVKGLRLQAQRAPQCSDGRLPEEALPGARDLAAREGPERAATFLEESGLSAETAAALARTLAFPIGNGSLVAMTRRPQEWAVRGLAVLEGNNGLWLLRPTTEGGRAWIDLSPCPALELRSRLTEIVQQARPGASSL